MHLYTLLVIVVGWVFFRSESLADALLYLKVLFMGNNVIAPFNVHYYLTGETIGFLLVGILVMLPLFRFLRDEDCAIYVAEDKVNIGKKAVLNLISVALFIVCMASIAANTYNPFLYFRF